MYFNLYIPAGAWGTLLVLLLLVVAHGGLSFFNYWYKKKNFQHNNEVAGIIFGVLSLIYSLLVAFVIVAVWQDYEDLKRVTEREADDINSVVVHSNMLPDSLKNAVSIAIAQYCRKVVNEEWDVLDNKELYQASAIPSLRVLLFKVHTQTKIQEDLLSLMDKNLSSISNLRRERLSHTRSYVPELVWLILIIGSVMVIIFSYFLHMEKPMLKRIFLSFLWGIIGISLFLVYMLDHPFIGSTQVSKEPYEAILKILEE